MPFGDVSAWVRGGTAGGGQGVLGGQLLGIIQACSLVVTKDCIKGEGSCGGPGEWFDWLGRGSLSAQAAGGYLSCHEGHDPSLECW
jgi:hypothetical protein